MVCNKCKSEIPDDANVKFCPSCGAKLHKGRHGVAIIVALCIIVLVSVFSVVLLQKHQAEEREKAQLEQIHEFQTDIAKVYFLIDSEKWNLEVIGDTYDFSSDLNFNLLFDSNYFVSYASSLLTEQVKTAMDQKSKIDKAYNEALESGCAEKEIIPLKEQADKLYSAYNEEYNLLVEETFTLTTFNAKYPVFKESLKSACDDTKKILEELNVDLEKVRKYLYPTDEKGEES